MIGAWLHQPATRRLALFYALASGIALLGVGGAVQADKGLPGSAEADRLEACVAPTPFMRRRHFELVEHQRDQTVRQGIRETTHSLAGCVACHVRKDAEGYSVAINAPGEFCAGCHAYVGASLDCFDCHAAVPTED